MEGGAVVEQASVDGPISGYAHCKHWLRYELYPYFQT